MVSTVNFGHYYRKNMQIKFGFNVSFEGKQNPGENNRDKESPLQQELEAAAINAKQGMPKITTAERILTEQKEKAKIIEALIKDAIKNGENLTIADIAQKTGMSISEVRSVIYRRTPLFDRSLYDQVKDTTHRPHLPTDIELNLAQQLTDSASTYMVTTFEDSEEPIFAEQDYVKELAKTLRRLQLSDASVKVLSEIFSQAPAFADTLISLKKKGGHPRCDGAKAKTLKDIFSAYEMNPDLTEELLREQNKDGDYCYSLLQIPKIVALNDYSPSLLEIAKESPIDVYYMYKMKALSTKELNLNITNPDNETNEEGKDFTSELTNETPRYSPDEIIGLYTWTKEFPELTQKLMADTMIDEVWYPRFSGKDICYILEQYQQYPDLVNSLINDREDIYSNSTTLTTKYRFRAGQICTILKQNEKTPKLISDMVNGRTDQYSRGIYNNNTYRIEPSGYSKGGDYRFSAYNICEILKYYDKHPNLLTQLVKAKTKTPDGKTVYKYEDYQILNILQNAQENRAKKS